MMKALARGLVRALARGGGVVVFLFFLAIFSVLLMVLLYGPNLEREGVHSASVRLAFLVLMSVSFWLMIYLLSAFGAGVVFLALIRRLTVWRIVKFFLMPWAWMTDVLELSRSPLPASQSNAGSLALLVLVLFQVSFGLFTFLRLYPSWAA